MLLKSSNSLTNDDIKLSERLNIPSSRLRGFESGKVGPKDGADFIGGNYLAALNFQSTLPKIFEDNQDIDILFFVDACQSFGKLDIDVSDMKIDLLSATAHKLYGPKGIGSYCADIPPTVILTPSCEGEPFCMHLVEAVSWAIKERSPVLRSKL